MCARDKAKGQGSAMFSLGGLKPIANGKTARLLQYYRLKQKHNIGNGSERKKVAYAPDWMMVLMTYARMCTDVVSAFLNKFDNRFSKIKSFLPHLLMGVALGLLAAIVSAKQNNLVFEKSNFWTFLYFTTFSIHFGAQVWMTSVSGIVLYFSLPRHVFGSVQEHLFPAFYTFNSVMSFILILSYVHTQTAIPTDSEAFVQVILMSLTYITEVFVRLYVAPPMLAVKHIKTQMEEAAGGGQEIGRHVLGELAHCPRYLKVLRSFRLLHSLTSVATITTVGCSFYHIYYLCDKLCL